MNDPQNSQYLSNHACKAVGEMGWFYGTGRCFMVLILVKKANDWR
jgi:hypothetical protein